MKNPLLTAFTGLVLLSLAGIAPVYGQSDPYDPAIYYRCYGHMVRSRPLAGDTRLAEVKARTTPAADACLQLLRSAQLQTLSGQRKTIGGVASGHDAVGQQILQTFHNFHRSWFANMNFQTAISGASDMDQQADIYDNGEPAYHITNALFNSAYDYDAIVTSNTTFQAIREANGSTAQNNPVRNRSLGKELLFDISPYNNSGILRDADNEGPRPLEPFIYHANAGEVAWTPTLIPTGKLVGIEPMPVDANNRLPGSRYQRDTPIDDVKASLGAGLLGSIPFLALNWGQSAGTEMNGGIDTARRWSKEVFSSVLCREIPVVRLGDVGGSADPFYRVDQSPQLPYRALSTCMQCHASMDNMAGVVRNIELTPSDNYVDQDTGYGTVHAFVHNVDRGAETVRVLDSDGEYHRRPANGKFYFRSFDGALHNQDIVGLSGLGTAISNTEDLYVCAAKRYFKFFTNIDVNVDDLNGASLGATETAYRNFVIQLGRELKSEIEAGGASNTDHVQNMFHKIFASEAYARPGQGVQ